MLENFQADIFHLVFHKLHSLAGMDHSAKHLALLPNCSLAKISLVNICIWIMHVSVLENKSLRPSFHQIMVAEKSNALIQQHDFVLCTSQGNRIHSRHIIKLPFHHSASAATKSLTWNLLSIRQQMNLFNVSHCHPESFQMRRHSKLLTLALQKLCNLQFLLRSACMNEVC